MSCFRPSPDLATFRQVGIWVILLALIYFRVSPVVCLLWGVVVASGSPGAGKGGVFSAKGLLNVAIILLGFGVPLGSVLQAGGESILPTAVSIVCVLGLGFLLTRVFRIERELGLLISCGTAICGGSAIAAVSRSMGSKDENTAQAMLVVFVLNGVALALFPIFGRWIAMSPDMFGLWSALAIHDTSSVVGAASTFGDRALEVALVVKMVRSLWILPIALGAGFLARGQKKGVSLPWFIGGFLLAALARQTWPHGATLWDALQWLGKGLLSVALFRLGQQVNWRKLKAMGWPPLFMGTSLWIIVSLASAFVVIEKWIQ